MSAGLSVMLCIMLGACGKGGEAENSGNKGQGTGTDEITLKFVNWGSEGSTSAAFKKLIATYESEHEGITIESITVPYNQVLDQLLIMTSGGESPDCAQIHGSMVSALAAAGALAPLDEYVSEETRNDYYENVLEPLVYDDQLIGLPWVPSPDILYYNKDLLEQAGYEEPPKTPAELYEMSEAIGKLPADDAENKIYGLGIASKKLPGTGYQFLPYLWAEGGNIVDEEGNVTMDTPEMKKALGMAADLMKNETIPIGLEINDLRGLFAAGQLGFIFDGDYAPTTFAEQSSEGEAFLEKLGMALPPVGADGKYMSGFYEHDLGVFKESEHKEEAVEFIQWLSSAEAIEIYSELSGTKTPARKSVRELDLYSAESNPDFQLFLETLENSYAFPQKNSGFQKGMEEMAEAIQRVGINHEEVDVVTADLQERVSKLYQN